MTDRATLLRRLYGFRLDGTSDAEVMREAAGVIEAGAAELKAASDAWHEQEDRMHDLEALVKFADPIMDDYNYSPSMGESNQTKEWRKRFDALFPLLEGVTKP